MSFILLGILNSQAAGGKQKIFVAGDTSGKRLTSPDGVTWTQTAVVALEISDGAFGAELYVMVGKSGRIDTSPDAITWTARNTGTNDFYGLDFVNDVFILTGDNVFKTSTNGTGYTDRSGPGGGLTCAAYGDGVYVVGGNSGVITTSTNLSSWTSRTSGFGTDYITGLAYGAGLFVAVGWAGKITTSPDGTTWTSRSSNFGSYRIFSVAYSDGLFVAVGQEGKIDTSTNGTSWTARTSGFGTDEIYNVSGGEGLWVATGQGGKIISSTNGTSWTSRTSGTTSSIFGITFG